MVDVDPDDGRSRSIWARATRSPPRSCTSAPSTTDDVAVELLHGPVAAGDELTATEVVRMELIGPAGREPEGRRQRVRLPGQFSCDQAGRHGYTVRVVPPTRSGRPVEMGCVTWA